MMFRYNNSNKKDLKPFPILYTTHARTKKHTHTYSYTIVCTIYTIYSSGGCILYSVYYIYCI